MQLKTKTKNCKAYTTLNFIKVMHGCNCTIGRSHN